ncbi:hypothetical protein PMAYCL1PPCAC_07710, partial [Pristionchus mayeri]
LPQPVIESGEEGGDCDYTSDNVHQSEDNPQRRVHNRDLVSETNSSERNETEVDVINECFIPRMGHCLAAYDDDRCEEKERNDQRHLQISSQGTQLLLAHYNGVEV